MNGKADEYLVVRSKHGSRSGYWRVRRNGRIASQGFATRAEAEAHLLVILSEMAKFPVLPWALRGGLDGPADD